MGKGNFIDTGAFSWDTRFNTLARVPGDRANNLPGVALRRMEKAMAHVKSSRCARLLWQEADEKIKRARDAGMLEYIHSLQGEKTCPNHSILQEVRGRCLKDTLLT